MQVLRVSLFTDAGANFCSLQVVADTPRLSVRYDKLRNVAGPWTMNPYTSSGHRRPQTLGSEKHINRSSRIWLLGRSRLQCLFSSPSLCIIMTPFISSKRDAIDDGVPNPRGGINAILSIAFACLSFTLVSLRLLVRLLVNKLAGPDDYLIVGSLVMKAFSEVSYRILPAV